MDFVHPAEAREDRIVLATPRRDGTLYTVLNAKERTTERRSGIEKQGLRRAWEHSKA